MNVKKTFLWGLIPLFIFSCQSENNTREVYLNLKLGGSKADAEKFYREFRLENDPQREHKYTSFKHEIPLKGNYYSSPIFYYPPNDTLIHTIEILYFIKPDDGDAVISDTKRGYLAFSIDENSYGFNASVVFDNISNEIEAKYGKPDKIETINNLRPNHNIKKWINKNGVNITLDYTYEIAELAEGVKFYNIKLKFTFTDEMISKIFKRKSIY